MFLLLTILYFPWLPLSAPKTISGKPQLVVILLDGVRWDYFKYFQLTAFPGYQQFFENGVHAEYMETVFPSDSFPSWTTLQTGLYPESHGILGNLVFNKENGETISIDDDEWSDSWWQDVEPIWITAKKQGLRVATYQWNSANVSYHEMLPDVVSGFPSQNFPSLSSKIQNAEEMLKAGFDLVLLYHGNIDRMGHIFGPTCSKVKEEMEYVGQQIDHLFTFVQNSSLSNDLGNVQIIVVSDHGITNVCPPLISYLIHFNAIELKKNTFSTRERKEIFNITLKSSFYHKSSGQINIYTEPAMAERLITKIRHIKGFQVFLRKDIPEELHYKRGKYAPDVILIDKMNPSIWKICGGRHGFSPKHPDMRAVFLAWGSAFVAPQEHPPMHIVDVYQIICHVLGIKPMPHNGSWERIASMMKQDPDLYQIRSILNPN